jgi:hypothetical protein
MMDHPLLVFLLSFVVLLLAAELGDTVHNRVRPLKEEERADFGIELGATLTLLGLLIGFSFSMAVSRYDQRKNYEEEEANAIGTEYVRADLLPADHASKVHDLLKKYLDQRVSFYTTRNPQRLAKVNEDTADLENQLWVRGPGSSDSAHARGGSRHIRNERRIELPRLHPGGLVEPHSPGGLVADGSLAICCNFMIGYGAHRTDRRIFLILPLAVSVAFFLISDIDSPRGGAIRVVPQNLLSLAQSLHTQ